MRQFSYPNSQFTSLTGAPSVGWTMSVYETGTSTLASLYSDAALTFPTDNPVVADAQGFFASFYWSGTVDVVVRDADSNTIDSADGITDLATEVLNIIASSTNGIPSGTATGTGDAISLTLNLDADFANLAPFIMKANANNTGTINTPNLTVDSYPTRRVKKGAGEALLANDITAGGIGIYFYNEADDSYYQLAPGATFLRRDGTYAMLGALNMGGFKITNIADGEARTDAPSIGQIQDSALVAAPTSVTLTGSLTNGSAIVTGMTGALQLYAGLSVSGTGIPGATTINSVDSDSQITLSANATATTSSSLTFTGTANLLALFPSPRITAVTASMAFDYISPLNNTGAMQVIVSGCDPVNIKKFATSPLVADDNVAGYAYRILHDGTQFQLLNPSTQSALPGPVKGAFSGLSLSATGTNLSVAVSANEVTLENTSNNVYTTVRNVSVTINTQSSGADGLDTGSLAANTWYAVFLIYNGTTTAGLISTSATSPTLPSGYTYKARVGWIRTDGTADKYPRSFKQAGRRGQWVVSAGSNVATARTMISGDSGTLNSSLTAVAVANYVPPTASRIIGAIYQKSTGNLTMGVQASPNSIATDAGGPGVFLSQSINTAYANQQVQFDFMLESSNIYYAANNGGSGSVGMLAIGWEDDL